MTTEEAIATLVRALGRDETHRVVDAILDGYQREFTRELDAVRAERTERDEVRQRIAGLRARWDRLGPMQLVELADLVDRLHELGGCE